MPDTGQSYREAGLLKTRYILALNEFFSPNGYSPRNVSMVAVR